MKRLASALLALLIWCSAYPAAGQVPALRLNSGAASPVAQATSIFLRVNQVAYEAGESKVALALTNETLDRQPFSVQALPGNAVVYRSIVGQDRGRYGQFAHLYELDFSGLTAPGQYRLVLGSEISPPFTVGSQPYSSLLSSTLSFFQVQRCGNTAPRLHAACHLRDGVASGGPLDGKPVKAEGGWHDAAGYIKFTGTTSYSLALMLSAYLRHPDVFARSGAQGLPNVLAESRVGLDWLLRMWDPQNQVLYYQVGNADDNNDWRMPEGDDRVGPPRPVYASEPGHGANLAGRTAASLALAAVAWNDPAQPYRDPTLAAQYLEAARQIYAWGKLRPLAQSATDNFYDENSSEDDMALGAAELYRATGVQTYLREAEMYALTAGAQGSFSWADMHPLAQYEIARLDRGYAPAAAYFLNSDLAGYATAMTDDAFGVAIRPLIWGSTELMSGAALTALWYHDLTASFTYHRLPQAQRDYILGANPWGVSFVGGVGAVWPRHPQHEVADLTNTELIGFWDEGPVTQQVFVDEDIHLGGPDVYAAFQSPEAVFHDDIEDYTTNEPTITMNAQGLALTSWYAPPLAGTAGK